MNEDVWFYLIGLVIAIILAKFIIGWYHEIEKRNRYMETQIKLLAHIAAASGVNLEKVAEVVVKAKLPEEYFVKQL